MISDVYQSSCVHGRVEGSATVGCAVHVAYPCTWQQESGAERGIVGMLPSWQYGLHSQHGYGQCYLHGQSQSGQVWQLAPVVALGGWRYFAWHNSSHGTSVYAVTGYAVLLSVPA